MLDNISKVEDYGRLIKENKSKIEDLTLINAALKSEQVKYIKLLYKESYHLSAESITKSGIWQEKDKCEEFFKNRFFAYYDLEVSNMSFISRGINTDMYILEFDYLDNRYSLAIPNLKGPHNLIDCNNGKYSLRVESSKNIWDFVKGSNDSYFVSDVLKPLLTLNNKKSKKVGKK